VVTIIGPNTNKGQSVVSLGDTVRSVDPEKTVFDASSLHVYGVFDGARVIAFRSCRIGVLRLTLQAYIGVVYLLNMAACS